jgi:outer membrane protein TolC
MRPDWRSAQKEVESADELETSKYRLLYPSLDAAAASGYYSDAVGASFQWAWSGSLLLNFPLFDRLTTLSNARVQAYAKKQAEVTLETVRRQAQSEWDSALAGFRTALSSARSRDQVLRKSREIYQDQLRRFQLGKISANDLAVDEQRFHDSELLAVNGWAAVHVNLADLCHARGLRVSGDWERCWLQ